MKFKYKTQEFEGAIVDREPRSGAIQILSNLINIDWEVQWIHEGSLFTSQPEFSDAGITWWVPACWETKPVVVKGANCKRCKDYNEYAEPNRPDGSFICYRCRHV